MYLPIRRAAKRRDEELGRLVTEANNLQMEAGELAQVS
jgi:hypothetical protein